MLQDILSRAQSDKFGQGIIFSLSSHLPIPHISQVPIYESKKRSPLPWVSQAIVGERDKVVMKEVSKLVSDMEAN